MSTRQKKYGFSLLILSIFASILCSCTTTQPKADTTMNWLPLNEPGCGGCMTGVIVSPHDSDRILLAGDMLGVGLSTNQGDTWNSTFGFKSWEIADATWHPSNPEVVWIGTMSGPYKSTDGGLNWQEKRKGFPKYGPYFYSAPIEKVLYDPTNNSRLLAFGGSSRRWRSPGKPKWGLVWESLDGGESWKILTTITAEGSSTDNKAKGFNIIAASYLGKSGNKLIVSVLEQGIYLSNDNGKTWTKSNKGLPHSNTERIAVHPTNDKIAWASLNNFQNKKTKEFIPGGVYKTTDGGLTWKDSSEGLSRHTGKSTHHSAKYMGLAIAKTNPKVLYVCDNAWNTGIIYKSTDAGKSWKPVATKKNFGLDGNKNNIYSIKTAYQSGLSMRVLTIDPNNENIVYGLGSEYVVKSDDGGRTWRDITSIQVDAEKKSWIGTGYSGLCSMNFAFSPTDKNHWLAQAMDAGKLWQTFDGGKSWIRYFDKPHPWGGSRDSAFAGGDNIYITMGQNQEFLGIGKSTDAGRTWTILAGKKNGLPELGHNHAPNAIYAAPTDSNKDKVWLTHRGNLYYSENSGENWKIILKDKSLRWFAGNPKNPLHFFISSKNGVYETRDGINFNNIKGSKFSQKMAVDNEGTLYVACRTKGKNKDGGLWTYKNKIWTQILADEYAYSIALDPVNPQRMIVSTSDNPYHDECLAKKLWFSDDQGKSWSNQIKGLDMTRGETVKFNPHDNEMIVFGSLGRGFFTMKWPEGYALENRVQFNQETKKNLKVDQQ